jgi:DNA adenine methylase
MEAKPPLLASDGPDPAPAAAPVLVPVPTPLHPVLRRREASILSPLRYPGSKRRLAAYVERALQLNGLRPQLFVEPFAGGASVALQLLNDGAVERIGLMDLDPLVASFWKTVFNDTEWLVRQIERVPVNVDEWRRWRRSSPSSTRQLALKCLFLNRTSFSGILGPSAGPIGGWSEKSAYGIDCRFPRDTLIRRVLQAAALRDRVAFVWNVSWKRGISKLRRLRAARKLPRNVFYYFDPPFFEKADRLYNHFFDQAAHELLRDHVLAERSRWLLSYDSARRVRELYGRAPRSLHLLYTVSAGTDSRSAREIVLSNLPRLPGCTQLWQTAAEWARRKNTSASRIVASPVAHTIRSNED